ncbi:MAG: nucleotide sugar dehydrogenase [Thermotogota bacterium]|nr:nucleotide sugar dehydrogenase [Thermotogota bacterium]
MKICVLGLGYIGLPTALLLANAGNEVVGVDINDKIVEKLNHDKIPFEELGLIELFENAGERFQPQGKVESADVFLIAVPTPLDPSIHTAELRPVKSAAESIIAHLSKNNLVILESTVPPGTSEKLLLPTLEKSGIKAGEFYLAHSPERAIPGNTIYEMIHNHRVIGGYDKKSAEMTKSVYESFVEGKMHLTNLDTAEFVKLMENTFRDINIALANEFAQIGEENNINVWDAIDLANKHPRVDILKPGPGVGGHCIAIDPWFLASTARNSKMINLAREINNSMPNFVLRMVREMTEHIKSPVITAFGVAYKGNVDDTRETPALKFIKLAENRGYKVKCYDPHVKHFEYELFDLDEAVKDSDCIVIIADHRTFKHIDPKKLKMRNKNVVDTRNIINHDKWKDAGFNVKLLGCGKC